MRDVHCHILPGVDDGARTMQESLLMLSEAMRAGITSIVCTYDAATPGLISRECGRRIYS